eukprot:1495307-Rhodomonas_salina.3
MSVLHGIPYTSTGHRTPSARADSRLQNQTESAKFLGQSVLEMHLLRLCRGDSALRTSGLHSLAYVSTAHRVPHFSTAHRTPRISPVHHVVCLRTAHLSTVHSILHVRTAHTPTHTACSVSVPRIAYHTPALHDAPPSSVQHLARLTDRDLRLDRRLPSTSLVAPYAISGPDIAYRP